MEDMRSIVRQLYQLVQNSFLCWASIESASLVTIAKSSANSRFPAEAIAADGRGDYGQRCSRFHFLKDADDLFFAISCSSAGDVTISFVGSMSDSYT